MSKSIGIATAWKHASSIIKYHSGVWLGIRDPLIPPKTLHSVGNSDFITTGQEFVTHFTQIGGLKPTDKILDVGCGTGRMARPLVPFVTTGSYDGLDIVESSIRWCQRVYRSHHANFNFHWADLYNKMYNPGGKIRDSAYQFPFAYGQFDFVFLTSVFTHMLPEGTQQYLREIGRVLKPGGTAFITCFLLNEQSRILMRQPASTLCFNHALNDCWTLNADIPESAVAYDEQWLRRHCLQYQLQIREPVHYGRWCARLDGVSLQDIVIATKTA